MTKAPSSSLGHRLLWICVLVLLALWGANGGPIRFHRNFVLLPALVFSVYLIWRSAAGWQAWMAPLGRWFWLMLALLFWILLAGLWQSADILAFLQHFNGKWLRYLETGCIGLAVGRLILLPDQKRWTTLLIAAWVGPALHAVIVTGQWIMHGEFPLQAAPLSYSRLEMSVHVNLVIALLLGEVVLRVRGMRLAQLPLTVIMLMLAVCILGQVQMSTRNAMIELAIILAAAVVLATVSTAARSPRRIQWWHVMLGVLGVVAVLQTSVQVDKRWQSLHETIAIALDTDRYQSWRDHRQFAYPLLSSGEPVDASNYDRIAWLKIGLGFMREHPFGIGYHGPSFKYLVEQKYGTPSTTSQAHWGFINLGLAWGIPAMAIWYAGMVFLIVTGARRFTHHNQAAGVLLCLLACSFTMRSLIDDVLRDHMLEELFFYSAVLLVLSRPENIRQAG